MRLFAQSICRFMVVLAVLPSTGSALIGGAEGHAFPFGLYDKTEHDNVGASSAAGDRRLMDFVAAHGFNTIVMPAYRDAKQAASAFDEARRHGLRVVMSVGNALNPQWDFAGPGRPFAAAYSHPAVIAYKYGDEPKGEKDLKTLRHQYAAIRQHYRRPVLTAVAGEGMDFSAKDVALRMWSGLHSEIRFARHYPLRRTFDLRDWPLDKMSMSFTAWAANMEDAASTPWWYIAQTFGKGRDRVAASYWRLPTARELSALVHVALANGARGIIGYSLQDHGGQYLGLVDQQLKPNAARDGSVPLDEFAALARLAAAHAGLLLRHGRATFDARLDSDAILAVPRRDPLKGDSYVYLVNLDTESDASGLLAVSKLSGVRTATDVYSGAIAKGEPAGEGVMRFGVSLKAGEGQFWRLGEADAGAR